MPRTVITRQATPSRIPRQMIMLVSFDEPSINTLPLFDTVRNDPFIQ